MMIAVEKSAVKVVEVVHGAEFVRHQDLVGSTVAHVRSSCLRHVLNIRPGAVAWLNGRRVWSDEALKPGDVLEFLDGPGQKGNDDAVTPQEFRELTGFWPPEYEYLITQGMPVIPNGNDQILLMGRIRKWLLDQPGILMAAARTAVARTRLRIDEKQGTAILDGHPYHVTETQAMMLQVLLDNLGNWVSSTQMVKAQPMLDGVRPGRHIKKLPQAIQDLIESGTKGQRLRLE